MIDNQDQVKRLLRRLIDVLPLAALATPALVAHLPKRSSAAKITSHCQVTDIFYAGDEGGVTCHVIFDQEEKEQVFLVQLPTPLLIAGSRLRVR